MTAQQFLDARHRLGLTQAEFAERLGYADYRVVAAKERGRRPVRRQDEIVIKAMTKSIDK